MLGLGSLSEAPLGAIRNTSHSNLLSNPQFEVNTSTWSAFSWTLSRDTTAPINGAGSGLLTATGGYGGLLNEHWTTPIPALPGQWFTFSLWVANATVSGASFTVQMDFSDSGGGAVATCSATFSVPTGSGATRVAVSGAGPAGTVRVTPEVYATGITGEQFRVDKLMLDPNESLTGFIGPLYGDAGLSASVGLSASGSASGGAVSGNASRTETVSLTSTGTVGKVTGSSLTGNVTLSAASGTAGGGSLTATVALVATGIVGRIGNASLTETVALTATGAAGKVTGASSTVSVTLSASGSTGKAAGANLDVTATTSADGTVPPFSADSNLSVTLTLASDGTVRAPRILFSPPSTIERENRRYAGGLWWVPSTGGYTVFRRSGVWHVQENPAGYDLTGADLIYLGGRTYEVTPAERDVLITAGFGSGIYYET